MRQIVLIILALLAPLPAFAGAAEAKELARSYNCRVTSIAPVNTETGTGDTSVYKVGCDTSGVTNDEARKANGTLYVRCNGALCTLQKKGE